MDRSTYSDAQRAFEGSERQFHRGAAERAENGFLDINRLTSRILGAALAVHRELGPGLLESTYETCMAFELEERRLAFQRQYPVPLIYKQRPLDCGYRIDLLVERSVVVELKAVERLDPIHLAQVLTYLKISGCQVGLLINFNERLLKDGIRRVVRRLPEPIPRPPRLRGE